jgi:hypothetical protein
MPTLTCADATCGTASTASAAAPAINSPLRRVIFITCSLRSASQTLARADYGICIVFTAKNAGDTVLAIW